MFGKAAIVALLAIFAAPGDTAQDAWSGMTVNGLAHFKIPRDLPSALKEGWTSLTGATNDRSKSVLGYRRDPRFGLIFDVRTGTIVGFQVAFPVRDVDLIGNVVNYKNVRGITMKRINNENYWTAAIHYSKKKDGTLQAWFETNSQLIELPTNLNALRSKGYFKKACMPGKGTYYSWITAAATSANIPPWNPIVAFGQVVGFLFLGVGSPTSALSRNWYEVFTPQYFKEVIPDASQSLLKDVRRYGVFAVQVWLSDIQSIIGC